MGAYTRGPNMGQARPMQAKTRWLSSPPGTDSARPLTVKKFVTHTTCRGSLGLQEHETYLIMGQISDLWRVKSECVAGGLLLPWGLRPGPLSLPHASPLCQNFYCTCQQESRVSGLPWMKA